MKTLSLIILLATTSLFFNTALAFQVRLFNSSLYDVSLVCSSNPAGLAATSPKKTITCDNSSVIELGAQTGLNFNKFITDGNTITYAFVQVKKADGTPLCVISLEYRSYPWYVKDEFKAYSVTGNCIPYGNYFVSSNTTAYLDLQYHG